MHMKLPIISFSSVLAECIIISKAQKASTMRVILGNSHSLLQSIRKKNYFLRCKNYLLFASQG